MPEKRRVPSPETNEPDASRIKHEEDSKDQQQLQRNVRDTRPITQRISTQEEVDAFLAAAPDHALIREAMNKERVEFLRREEQSRRQMARLRGNAGDSQGIVPPNTPEHAAVSSEGSIPSGSLYRNLPLQSLTYGDFGYQPSQSQDDPGESHPGPRESTVSQLSNLGRASHYLMDQALSYPCRGPQAESSANEWEMYSDTLRTFFPQNTARDTVPQTSTAPGHQAPVESSESSNVGAPTTIPENRTCMADPDCKLTPHPLGERNIVRCVKDIFGNLRKDTKAIAFHVVFCRKHHLTKSYHLKEWNIERCSLVRQQFAYIEDFHHNPTYRIDMIRTESDRLGKYRELISEGFEPFDVENFVSVSNDPDAEKKSKSGRARQVDSTPQEIPIAVLEELSVCLGAGKSRADCEVVLSRIEDMLKDGTVNTWPGIMFVPSLT